MVGDTAKAYGETLALKSEGTADDASAAAAKVKKQHNPHVRRSDCLGLKWPVATC